MSLVGELKEVVGDYFTRYPNMSINALAKKSGVGATTIRRILNDDVKKSIAPHTVLNLVSAISKEKRLAKLIRLYQGQIGSSLERNFSAFIEEEMPHTIDMDLNLLLQDSVSYFIYKMASNRTGIDKDLIAELYGKTGLSKLRELEEHGYIHIEGGVVHAKNKNFSLDIETAKKHLPELVKYYKSSQIDLDKNLFYTLSETINEDGIKKIKEIQKTAIKETYKVLNSPFYEGEIPYFTLQISDTLVPEFCEGVIQ